LPRRDERRSKGSDPCTHAARRGGRGASETPIAPDDRLDRAAAIVPSSQVAGKLSLAERKCESLSFALLEAWEYLMPMKKTKNAAALAAAGLAAAAHAQVSTDPNAELETVLITSQRAERISRGATGLDLDIHDTPQSISFVTSERMADFAATSINEALRL